MKIGKRRLGKQGAKMLKEQDWVVPLKASALSTMDVLTAKNNSWGESGQGIQCSEVQ
jgi:hypothetical protein